MGPGTRHRSTLVRGQGHRGGCTADDFAYDGQAGALICANGL